MASLIIKDKIRMLITGYPTVSDKYNVAGATLTGADAIKFGELVKYSGTQGYVAKAAGATTVNDIAGFALATNVKLAEGFPGTEVQINPGEAFNLLVNGFMAVELDSAATVAEIKPNAPVDVILASGKVTTNDKAAGGTIVAIPNVIFTGTYENHGTEANPILVAEVYVK